LWCDTKRGVWRANLGFFRSSPSFETDSEWVFFFVVLLH
jgi:hypothetical protein